MKLTKIICCLLFYSILNVVNTSPINEDKPLDCPVNENYYRCTLGVCYKTCQHLKIPPPCPNIAADCFVPGCECINGYLRNESGVCVPEAKCLQKPYCADPK